MLGLGFAFVGKRSIRAIDRRLWIVSCVDNLRHDGGNALSALSAVWPAVRCSDSWNYPSQLPSWMDSWQFITAPLDRLCDALDMPPRSFAIAPWQALLERGFATLMDSQRLPELKMMYQLFQRVQALDEVSRGPFCSRLAPKRTKHRREKSCIVCHPLTTLPEDEA